MTTTTDVSPPADDSGVATEQPKNSQHRSSRLNQALAWVGVVAGGLFIVAAIFFSGFFLSWGLGGPSDGHKGAAPMACCDEMKAGQPMKPGAMMAPGGQMKARRDDARRDDGTGSTSAHIRSPEHPSAIAPRVENTGSAPISTRRVGATQSAVRQARWDSASYCDDARARPSSWHPAMKSDEESTRGDLPAFEDVSELVLTVLLPVGTDRELHVMLLNLIVDGLFALLVRRGSGIGRGGRAEDNDGGANARHQP